MAGNMLINLNHEKHKKVVPTDGIEPSLRPDLPCRLALVPAFVGIFRLPSQAVGTQSRKMLKMNDSTHV